MQPGSLSDCLSAQRSVRGESPNIIKEIFGESKVNIHRKVYQGVDSDMTNATVPSASTITVNEMTNYTIMNRAVASVCTGDRADVTK